MTREADRTAPPADRWATVIGLVLLAFLVAAAVWASALINFVATPCGLRAYRCDRALIASAVGLAQWGPIAIGLAALAGAVIRLRARRSSAWIPAVAALSLVALFPAAESLARLGVGR